ncbi:MAG: nicotinate (nicotinamide) nucleotide adenylyltransferase [Treponema sp.]|jgi:nicotinate-nucleotide adenylyltransferase|nr:nicotinate (nicotinamide) nucleotide adenylyltransferase [Treponema sp.]
MKVALFGGSFDPIHNGHLSIAESVLNELGYERIIFVPAYQSPFKYAQYYEKATVRVDLILAAIIGDPRLSVDDCEIRRENISYTVDTVNDIIARYRPTGTLGLIIGADMVAEFPQWKNVTELVEKTTLIIAKRPGTPHINIPFPCIQLNNDGIHISSSEVRSRIQKGTVWHHTVPQAVRRLIEERGLYHHSTAFNNTSLLSRIEQDARSRLTQARFLHSRQVALLSFDLCRYFGLNAESGYFVGMAHDICKSLSGEELFRIARRDGSPFSALEQKKPELLHARAAAVFVQEYYGIKDKAIVESIRVHTTGMPGMGPLAKVLYVADKIEVSRYGVDPALRELNVQTTLDSLVLKVLRRSITTIREKGYEVSTETLALLEELSNYDH